MSKLLGFKDICSPRTFLIFEVTIVFAFSSIWDDEGFFPFLFG